MRRRSFSSSALGHGKALVLAVIDGRLFDLLGQANVRDFQFAGDLAARAVLWRFGESVGFGLQFDRIFEVLNLASVDPVWIRSPINSIRCQLGRVINTVGSGIYLPMQNL